MTDPDRGREIPREPLPRETVRDTERTTIIQTGGGRDRGGGGVILPSSCSWRCSRCFTSSSAAASTALRTASE